MKTYLVKYQVQQISEETQSLVVVPLQQEVDAESVIDAINKVFSINASDLTDLQRFLVTARFELIDVV